MYMKILPTILALNDTHINSNYHASSFSSVVQATAAVMPTGSTTSVAIAAAVSASVVSASVASVASGTAASSSCSAGSSISQGSIPVAKSTIYNIAGDAPYSVSQSALQAQISFPNGYFCRENLILLVPGTAGSAIETYSSTLLPVLEGTSDIDVALLTIPDYSLEDASVSAEYVAYAINYLATTLNRKPTVAAWSQGNLNTQWALAFWPSTVSNTKNYVGYSPDYDGTVLANLICAPLNTAEQALSGGLSASGLTSSLNKLGVNLSKWPKDSATARLGVLGLITETNSSSVSKRASGPDNMNPVGTLLGTLGSATAYALESLSLNPTGLLQTTLGSITTLQDTGLSLSLTNLSTGCNPSVWQQTYGSMFTKELNSKTGGKALVPTSTIFSLTDEIVQPQGVTGEENASGYLDGAENTYIQATCPTAVVTHEGVLYSGAGIEITLAAARSGGTAGMSDIPASQRCALVSSKLTQANAASQEATVPGLVLRILADPPRVSSEPSLPSYA